ncbi:D-hexose-6-phosphate mutarotase [Alishewanella longhuensis]|uniref:Putative glucose-6-phosphate 1-epimerase n=1 Tax=Alishewanella longhuensis TaxID=1091037 RepID=A0ABQ3KZ16_9ALTE|nr:D-hexose-6-phosphate mutarotase [Alishewanella longhuensis]GHG71559.1 D-hexose-6-phosphate mutarotase [Alishewanella longhuensis]
MSNVTAITGFAHLHDLPCYLLSFGEAKVVVSSYGAQVLSYQPKPDQELLWLSPLAVWQQQQPIRGGVPVCWPWFGSADSKLNPQQQSLPNHGLVRTRHWTLQQSRVTADYSELCLSVQVKEFPYQAKSTPTNKAEPTKTTELLLSLRLTATSLSINLSCEQSLLQQAALHSYFKVDNLAQTQVNGIGEHYRDKVLQNRLVTADPDLRFNKEIDRIYSHAAAELALNSALHQVAITQQGFDSTVVWNPGEARSATIADLAKDSYQQFVCVESARLDLSSEAPLCLTQFISLQQS